MAKVEPKDYSVTKEVIRESIDPILLLEHYGVDIPQRNIKYDKVRCACPIHGGDNPTGFSFDLNTKQFTCFTQHCGEDPADHFWQPKSNTRSSIPRDLFLFIKLMEEKKAYEEGKKGFKCTWNMALKKASEIAGIELEKGAVYNKDIQDKLANQRWIREMAKVNQDVELEVFSEEDIEIYQAQLPIADDYLATRNIDDEILDFFQIGYSPDGIDEPYHKKKKDFMGRIVFPVRDDVGNLVGWSGRLATDDKKAIKRFNKWQHKLDFDKGFVLYNYHNAKEHIKDSKELILVEGPWDALRLWSYGIHNVVAVMGSALTPEQLSLAVSSALKVYVMLDSDGAGKSGANRICEQLKPYVSVYTIEADSGKDPDELSFDEAWVAVSNPVRYLGKKVI
jgi:5S rRNA maturation endonuclease (ribonuclease M5)